MWIMLQQLPYLNRQEIYFTSGGTKSCAHSDGAYQRAGRELHPYFFFGRPHGERYRPDMWYTEAGGCACQTINRSGKFTGGNSNEKTSI